MSANEMKAIDWAKIQDLLSKAPQIFALVKQLVDLFYSRPLMAATHCPNEQLCACCEAAIKAQLQALLELAHVHQCCAKEE